MGFSQFAAFPVCVATPVAMLAKVALGAARPAVTLSVAVASTSVSHSDSSQRGP